MKISKRIYFILFTAIGALLISSCKDDDELFPNRSKSPKNLAELTAENPALSTLSVALGQVGLDSTLATANTFTMFAPLNEAFSGIDLTTMTDSALANVLSNHIRASVNADFVSTMSTGYVTTSATGPDGNNLSLYTHVDGDNVMINGMATIVNDMKDIGGTNGVLHVVDGVLLPPTVVDHVSANPDYSTFASALAKADMEGALSGVGPFTVFAPSNAAFEMFMSEVNGAFGWTTLEDIPFDVLRDVLSYHVVSGENMLASDVDGTEPTTMQGETFAVSGTIINDASYTDANINLTDIQGINGVVHGIDKVLLPEEVFQSILSATLNLPDRIEDRGFSTFMAAARKTDMMDYLANNELTAFVPSNQAFESFFIKIEEFESVDDFDTPEELALLKNVLEYHLHANAVLSSNLSNGPLSTIQGDDIVVDANEGNLTPSHEFAPKANLVTTNIGATNGIIHEISNVLVSDVDAAALGYPEPDTGAPVFALPVYYDGVESGFQDTWGGWGGTYTWNSTETVQNGSTAIKLDYDADAYGSIQIGGPTPTPDLSPYTTFHFSGYGAPGTGTTTVLVSLCDCDAGVNVDIVEGEWTRFTLPISGFTDTSLGAIRIKNTQAASSTIFVDDIGFDLQDTAPAFGLQVYGDGITDEWTDTGFDSDSWHYNTTVTWLTAENVYQGSASGKVEQQEGGVLKFGQGAPGYDLSAFTEFQFTVYTADAATFTVIIDGAWGEGYITPTTTQAGEWNTIVVPLSSFTADFTTIETIELQVGGVDSSLFPYTYYIDEIGFN